MRESSYWHDFLAKHLQNNSDNTQNRCRRLSEPAICRTTIKNLHNNENEENFSVNNAKHCLLKRPSLFMKENDCHQNPMFRNDNYCFATATQKNCDVSCELPAKPKPPVPPKPAFLLPCYQTQSTVSVTFLSPSLFLSLRCLNVSILIILT